MENYEYFLEEYLEIAREGAESTLQGVKRIGLLIFRSLLVVVLVPFWLVGKRERHLTQRALDAAIAFPELNAALEKFASSLANLGKPPRQ
jgi:hypothetical protein